MKTITIGDIHGRSDWQEIDPTKYDKIIFVGDYVDSHTISDIDIITNLLNIIRFKKDNMDKVVLLLGNHDLQYLFNPDEYWCSGYRFHIYNQLHQIFNDDKELFQMAFQYDDTIWTHAGIHDGWYRFHFRYTKGDTLADKLNNAFYENYKSLFNVGHIRGGYNHEGGPFWADILELRSAPFKKMNQIVGHNRVKEITKINKYDKEIVFVDILENESTETKFYEKEFK